MSFPYHSIFGIFNKIVVGTALMAALIAYLPEAQEILITLRIARKITTQHFPSQLDFKTTHPMMRFKILTDSVRVIVIGAGIHLNIGASDNIFDIANTVSFARVSNTAFAMIIASIIL